jgi:hypothetical protein
LVTAGENLIPCPCGLNPDTLLEYGLKLQVLSTKGGILMGLEIMGREGFMVDESRELLA